MNPNQSNFTNMAMSDTPEPSSIALLGLGGNALILRRRKSTPCYLLLA